jgi:hypothetical protein
MPGALLLCNAGEKTIWHQHKSVYHLGDVWTVVCLKADYFKIIKHSVATVQSFSGISPKFVTADGNIAELYHPPTLHAVFLWNCSHSV